MLHAPTLDTDELRPTHLQVDLGQLAHNYRAIDAFVGEATKVMPILKAKAYGHGLVEVARRPADVGRRRPRRAFASPRRRRRHHSLVLEGLRGDGLQYLAHDLHGGVVGRQLRAIDACAAATGRRAVCLIDTAWSTSKVHWYSAKLLEGRARFRVEASSRRPPTQASRPYQRSCSSARRVLRSTGALVADADASA
ncbi:MAG: alanine racemase [Polyangiales bacterium]